jgi:hypothetical protein
VESSQWLLKERTKLRSASGRCPYDNDRQLGAASALRSGPLDSRTEASIPETNEVALPTLPEGCGTGVPPFKSARTFIEFRPSRQPIAFTSRASTSNERGGLGLVS